MRIPLTWLGFPLLDPPISGHIALPLSRQPGADLWPDRTRAGWWVKSIVIATDDTSFFEIIVLWMKKSWGKKNSIETELYSLKWLKFKFWLDISARLVGWLRSIYFQFYSCLTLVLKGFDHFCECLIHWATLILCGPVSFKDFIYPVSFSSDFLTQCSGS